MRAGDLQACGTIIFCCTAILILLLLSIWIWPELWEGA